MQVYAANKRTYFDYRILETYEAGIVLAGYEVKAAKTGRMNLRCAFVMVRDGGSYLVNAHIGQYQAKNMPSDYNPERPRKLLLHAKEIRSLLGKGRREGLTLIPLRVYNKRGKLKLEVGLVRRKRKDDKRHEIRKRETERMVQQALRKERG